MTSTAETRLAAIWEDRRVTIDAIIEKLTPREIARARRVADALVAEFEVPTEGPLLRYRSYRPGSRRAAFWLLTAAFCVQD